MGTSFSDANICCNNDNNIHKETDLEIFKKERNKLKSSRKDKLSFNDEDVQDMNIIMVKNKKNTDFFEKHMKDSSFKNNASSSGKTDNLVEKVNNLAEFMKIKNTPILSLKVLNSSANMIKGTVFNISCQGLIDVDLNNMISGRKKLDGYVFFGYFPEDSEDIDFNIAPSRNNKDVNSDQVNM